MGYFLSESNKCECRLRMFTHLTEARSLRNVLVINELLVVSDESVKKRER